MDPVTILSAIPGVGPFIPYILVLGGVCAAVATVLPTPKPGTYYASIYIVVNWLALNIGKARNAPHA